MQEMITKIDLRVNPKATQRTKNRVAEHGNVFRFIRQGFCQGLKQQALLLACFNCRWQGWLPLSEVTINSKEKNEA